MSAIEENKEIIRVGPELQEVESVRRFLIFSFCE